METLIAQIQEIQNKITLGTVSSEELENMVTLSRDLYEKAVILRFKSYEEKVFPGRDYAPLNEVFTTIEENVAEIETEIKVEIVAETPRVEEAETPVVENMQRSAMNFDNVQPVFDFQLFDELEAKTKEAHAPISKAIEKEIIEEASETETVQEVEEEEKTIEEETIDAADFIKAEAELIEALTEVKEPIEITAEKVEVEKEEIIETVSTPLEATVEAPTNNYSSGTKSTLFNSIPSILVAGENNWMSGKIESLQSAFGFNDRLQCISELFNGSSEMYSETLLKLDQLSQFEEAKSLLTPIATQNAWDLESDLTIEFIHKVERRYI